jgi:hypothetical protein
MSFLPTTIKSIPNLLTDEGILQGRATTVIFYKKKIQKRKANLSENK